MDLNHPGLKYLTCETGNTKSMDSLCFCDDMTHPVLIWKGDFGSLSVSLLGTADCRTDWHIHTHLKVIELKVARLWTWL